MTHADVPEAVAADHAQEQPSWFARYASWFDDGAIIRWTFRGMLAATLVVLALDLRDLGAANGWFLTGVETPITTQPVLPPAVEIDSPEGVNDPRPFVTTDGGQLSRPMEFLLGSGGQLKAEGTIDPGAADRFAAELTARGEYVKVVSLNSPGGALEDAMAMARLVRDRNLDTEIADGALCASSCPLMFVSTLR